MELDIENYIKESKIVYAFLRLLDNLLPTSPFMFKISHFEKKYEEIIGRPIELTYESLASSVKTLFFDDYGLTADIINNQNDLPDLENLGLYKARQH
ncbi:hypothetical protein J007_04787 [Cryptococcus neoformans]|nr:hypothetical protein J007_04787 [Cryptococcus neoformans var. grubii]OXC59582.1 hypothetical protein C358_04903 [Cryptococcus neoformans var. grubii MW-RSA852]